MTSVETKNNSSILPQKAESRQVYSSDVTEQYVKNTQTARIILESGYKIKTHSHEIEVAHWLVHTFGGEIVLLHESKEPGSKTPDYLWNGRYWELKSVTTYNSTDRAVREAAKQIQNNPGGIILNILENGEQIETIENAVSQRFRRINLDAVDVLFFSAMTLKKIIRYKK